MTTTGQNQPKYNGGKLVQDLLQDCLASALLRLESF